VDHISSHLGAQRRKDKASERGDLMQYFMQKLNITRTRDGLGPLTMGRMGRIFLAVPTKDLYFLKSICDDAQKRGDLDSFCKKFWWEVSPKNHTEEAKKKQHAAQSNTKAKRSYTSKIKRYDA
jgi:hypothetical protein